MEHTPIPWALVRQPDGRYMLLHDGESITELVQFELHKARNGKWCKRAKGEAASNFAFIVKAVNNHERLVKALKNLFAQCAMIHRYGGEIDNTEEADVAITEARAAIAAAEGREA